ncbi:hypothetical protein K6U70_01370 [Vibrio vulnificus]|uniref:hypothetical protein n=1 Tax=Vibrio vulnificus TaxID=672 RepID=UPI001EEBDE9D|nr:hypothetical protein [Vibrio vulnificus]MCG6270862.1 hypothetical protein [Vibrio vulnificus]
MGLRVWLSVACLCLFLWRVRFQTRHLECVDEWIPVCTGMTTGRGGGAWRRCSEFLWDSGVVGVFCHHLLF